MPNRRNIPADPPELLLGEPPAPLRERPLGWNFGPDIIRMPEFCAPALGNRGTPVTIDAELPEKASGVLYALGGSGGGLRCYLDDGYLCYEYNLFILQRNQDPLRGPPAPPAGPKIEISTEYAEAKRAGPLNITMKVNGNHPTSGVVPMSAPLCFRQRLPGHRHLPRGPVSLDYFDRAPFPFNRTIDNVNVRYTT